MNNLNCTCCGTKFNSDDDLNKHRKMEMQHALRRYKNYIKNINKNQNICDCVCCSTFFPPTNPNINNIDRHNCQLRIIVSNELDQLWGNNIRTQGNDIHTDLIYMINDFSNPIILDHFIYFTHQLN